MGEGDSSLMGAVYGHIGCRGDVVKRVTTNAIKQEIYDLWLGGATTYCGVAASKFDRNWNVVSEMKRDDALGGGFIVILHGPGLTEYRRPTARFLTIG